MNVETTIRNGAKQLGYEDLKDSRWKPSKWVWETIINATLPFVLDSFEGRLV